MTYTTDSFPENDDLKPSETHSMDFPSFRSWKVLFTQDGDASDEGVSPAPDMPNPQEEELSPNRRIPEEEEYLPNEQEVPIEEPAKEGIDPYFPGKGGEIPLEREEEFPQSDPRW